MGQWLAADHGAERAQDFLAAIGADDHAPPVVLVPKPDVPEPSLVHGTNAFLPSALSSIRCDRRWL
jgi:hypothetical protein